MAEFRFGIVASDYERSLAFYRDGLGLEAIRSWDAGPEGRGTLFRAADGTIEVLSTETLPSAAPRGVWIHFEVPDVDACFERAVAKGLPILPKTPFVFALPLEGRVRHGLPGGSTHADGVKIPSGVDRCRTS